MCVFSLFKTGEHLPSVYFYSLMHNKEVLQAQGSEGFIDFVPREADGKAQGNLYLLFQSQVLQKYQKYIRINTVQDYKKQIKLHM